MVYEYCDIIKNSGIARNYANSFYSFDEAADFAVLDFVSDYNKIMSEAGIIELDKFSKNAITEESDRLLQESVGSKISEGLQKFWEKIKDIWAAIQRFFENRYNSIKNKMLKTFKETDLSKFRPGMEKIDKEINLGAFKKIDDLVTKLTDEAANRIDLTEFAKAKENPIGFLFSKAGIKSEGITDLESAKKELDRQIGEPTKINANWLLVNKNNIAEALEKSYSGIKDDYRKAKRAYDKDYREFKKLDKAENKEANIRYSILKIATAKQSLVIWLQQKRKVEFNNLVVLVAQVNLKCTKKNKVQESAELKFDLDFVAEAFAD